MQQPISRRRFLGKTAVLGAGLTILPSGLLRGASPNEKVNVALVGVGGRGQWFVDTIPRLQQVVAVCDVNREMSSSCSATSRPNSRTRWTSIRWP